MNNSKIIFNDVNDFSLKDKNIELASYSDLFDRINDSILILDPESLEIINGNPTSENFFNKSFKDINLFDSIDQNYKDFFAKHLNTLSRRYHNKDISTTFIINNEIKYVQISMGSLELKNKLRVIQLIIKDMTDIVLLQKKLEQLSITDGLTGLYNKRHFENSMKLKLEECLRNDSNFALIMMDIDNFKHYNDRNGHGAGDQLLKEFSEELRNRVRNIDIVCRYGGEEFAIICPNTDLEQSLLVANRIKEAINKRNFEFKEHQPLGLISASIGISNIPFHLLNELKKCNNNEEMETYLSKTITQMKKIADDNLYKAKQQGRNRIVT